MEGGSYTTGSCMTLCPSYGNYLVSKLNFLYYLSENAGTTAHQKNLHFPLPQIPSCFTLFTIKAKRKSRRKQKITWKKLLPCYMGRGSKHSKRMQGSKPKRRLIQNSDQLIYGIYLISCKRKSQVRKKTTFMKNN